MINSDFVFSVYTYEIDLTDYSLIPNGLVFVQNTYSIFLRTMTNTTLLIGLRSTRRNFVQENIGIYIYIYVY